MSLGETLRSAREALGLSVEDIKNSTQIMTRQIADLENEDFSSFADPIYVKGFVRLYARTVGLDPAPLLRELSEISLKSHHGRAPSPAPAVAPLDTPAPLAKVVASAPAPAPAPASAPAPAPSPAPASAPAPAPSPAPASAPAPAPSPAPAPAPASDTLPLGFDDEPAAPAPAAPEAPAPEAPPPAPSAPPAPVAKKVAATPLPFETRPEPAPLPAKRVAAVEHGIPAPEPPPSPREGPRTEIRHTEVDTRPVVKRLPEPEAPVLSSLAPGGTPVAPDPLPLDGPPLVFPGGGPAPSGAAASAPDPVLAKPAPARPAPVPAPSSAEREKEELFAPEKGRRRRDPSAPSALSLRLSRACAALRRAASRLAPGPGSRRRPALLAGIAGAAVLLVVAGLVWRAASPATPAEPVVPDPIGEILPEGGDEEADDPAPPVVDTPATTPATTPAATSPEPPSATPAPPAEPIPIRRVLPPPRSFAR